MSLLHVCACSKRHNIYWETIAVGPFGKDDKPAGFSARGDSSSFLPTKRALHPTRAEAMTDVCPKWDLEAFLLTRGERR